MSGLKWRRVLWLGTVCLGAMTANAAAQDETAAADASTGESIPVIPVVETTPAPALPPAQDAHGTPVQLDEIVVTATKRPKSLREIPASITAQSGEELEKRGAQGAEDILRNVPGVNFTAEPINAARITIRGISTGQLSNPTTGSLFGDVSFTDAYIPRVTLDPNPFDLQSVEVLKGPQGTLFGAAALNGAIRYVPAPPVFDSYELRYFAQYSWISEGDGGAMEGVVLNLPLGDALALRVMGFDRRAPGYVDDLRSGREDVNDAHQQGLRGILGWRPGENWDINLTYAWQRSEATDNALTDNTDGNLSRSTALQESPSSGQYAFGDLNLRYNFDWGSFVSESAWVHKDAKKFIDASRLLTMAAPLLAQPDYSESGTFSQELRLVSPEDRDARWAWVGGLFFSRQDIFFDTGYSVTALPGLPLGPLLPMLDALVPGLGGMLDQEGRVNLLRVYANALIEEQALFGEVTRRLGEDWELSLGGRYYRTSSGGEVVKTGALIAPSGTLQTVINDEIHESGFNPKASLLWRANPNVSLYAAASRGFRVGGLQPGFTAVVSQQQAPDVFKSDSLWSYETGLRTQWLEKTLRADISAFYLDWQDPQLLQNGAIVPIPFLDNVGGVESRGAEASVQWLLPFIPGLVFSTSGAYTKTQTSKPFVNANSDELPPGTPWPYAPEWQTATTLRYGLPVGDWSFDAAATHIYMGQAEANLEGDFKVFGYRQWDLLFSAANSALEWLPNLILSVNNLTDVRGIGNGDHSGVTTSYTDAFYIQPRTITLRLEGRFY